MRFIGLTSTAISSYILVAYTLERLIAVWLPIKVGFIMRPNIRKRIISVIVIFGLLFGTYGAVFFETLFEGGLEKPHCRFTPKYGISVSYILNLIFSIVAFILPCFLIFTLNILIIFKLIQNRREMASTNSSSSKAIELKVTINLLAVSFLFLIVFLPYFIISNLYDRVKTNMSQKTFQNFTYLVYICLDISLINYSCNFLIYSLKMPGFKVNLWQSFKCRWIIINRTGTIGDFIYHDYKMT